MSVNPQEAPRGPADHVTWKGFYAAATAACNLVPALAFQLSPSGQLEGRGITFFTVYLTTLPLSIAVTLSALIVLRGWFGSDQQRLAAIGLIMVASGFIGLSLGSSPDDVTFLEQVHGPPLAVLFQVALYVLAGYAFAYGPVLFIAGIASAIAAAGWVHEKAGTP